MIDNHELSIGFTMELAQHSDILNEFAQLPESKQKAIVDGAREVKSRSEVRSYVENLKGVQTNERDENQSAADRSTYQ